MDHEELSQSAPEAGEASREDPSEVLAAKLNPLRPFVERTAEVTFDGQDVFLACLISSFVKSFEFVELTSRLGGDGALFLTASLRSTTEEIILLNYLSDFCHEERDFVLTRLMALEVAQNIRYQNTFFRIFRPFQPVMEGRISDEERLKNELIGFWQQNGWPKFQGASSFVPPTREIAQKSEQSLLEVVYDFIYRLSSNAVHFRAGALLRMGWGPDVTHMTFSPKHLSRDYLMTCQIYGCYLLCLYFELFDNFLKPNESETEAIVELRRYLLWIARWPEMLTFEEMNVSSLPRHTLVSALFHGSYVRIMEGGFISGTKELLRLNQDGLPLWPTYRLSDS